MDKCREAFERFECEKYEANYDDMKKNWDWYESQFGYRYSPDSLRGKDWAVWQKAWQHQQAKVEELQKRVDAFERMFDIKWTEVLKVNNRIDCDQIIYGECVLGKFSIWWRSWKENDHPALEINDEIIDEYSSIDEAKQMAKSYLEQALKGEG